jgi:hypothetical protein
MPTRLRPLVLFVPLVLAGCGGSFEPPSGSAPKISLLNQQLGKTHPRDPGIGVNAYLWHAALDTLSFMPLQSADPFGGVIVTDWYRPPSAPNERFKATAFVLGRIMRADTIRVTIFRQVQQDGQWQDEPANPETATEIENKILARARELRAQSKLD